MSPGTRPGMSDGSTFIAKHSVFKNCSTVILPGPRSGHDRQKTRLLHGPSSREGPCMGGPDGDVETQVLGGTEGMGATEAVTALNMSSCVHRCRSKRADRSVAAILHNAVSVRPLLSSSFGFKTRPVQPCSLTQPAMLNFAKMQRACYNARAILAVRRSVRESCMMRILPRDTFIHSFRSSCSRGFHSKFYSLRPRIFCGAT